MNIEFEGKYKSISSFKWEDIPKFVVLTGANGSGKSQLLELLYKTIIREKNLAKRVTFSGEAFQEHEVTFLQGEWQLQNTGRVDSASVISNLKNYFAQFINGERNHHSNTDVIKRQSKFREMLEEIGKTNRAQVTEQEFREVFPDIFFEQERQIGQRIAESMFNYRLSEIECLAKGLDSIAIVAEIGSKPWDVIREIINEAQLPFEINDPSQLGFRDVFTLELRHTVLNEIVSFNDLSSGEKVLISLVFYLYNSQEKSVFPKLLLLDEPDAHLHPSMTRQFLSVIKNVLVDKYGVRVIMTTHSPSTVVLSADSALFRMSINEPRIEKCTTKNEAVAILTSGLVFVGEGTKYYLVEDDVDVEFYSYVYRFLLDKGHLSAEIPLVFIPASTSKRSGGKDVVQTWVEKVADTNLAGILNGLIDADSGNVTSDGVHKIDRYSIENYLIDPLLVFVAQLDKEKNDNIDGLDISIGEEFKLKTLDSKTLQKLIDHIVGQVEPDLPSYFEDFNQSDENALETVEFVGGLRLSYPKWMLYRRGKTLLNELYNDKFKSPIVNHRTLFKAMKKTGLIPMELRNKINALKADIKSES